MAKVIIKSERITPLGGIFPVREQFSCFVGLVIDKVLGLRCTSYGYQYSEIVGSLSSVYFCGGDCVEDVTSHLMPHLSLHPTLRTCSSDTILRGISELSTSKQDFLSTVHINATSGSGSGNSLQGVVEFPFLFLRCGADFIHCCYIGSGLNAYLRN